MVKMNDLFVEDLHKGGQIRVTDVKSNSDRFIKIHHKDED